MPSPKPRGLNCGKYCGEGIDVHLTLARLRQAALERGWREEILHETGTGGIPGYSRGPTREGAARRRLYLSAGIHGDEPAGPLAMLRLIEEDVWDREDELYLCPCLNPTGLALSSRESAQGLDLNRDYRHLASEEIRAHVAALSRQGQFDVAFCLHEDWEASGFYLYELNPDRRPSSAESMVHAAGQVCPIDQSPMIDGRPASEGIIRPDLDPATRSHWPEAFYLVQYHTRHSYTLEAPSDFDLPVRVEALARAVRAGIVLNTPPAV